MHRRLGPASSFSTTLESGDEPDYASAYQELFAAAARDAQPSAGGSRHQCRVGAKVADLLRLVLAKSACTSQTSGQGASDSEYDRRMSAKTVELQMTTEEAWAKLRSVASTIGKVEEASDAARYLIFKTRYGLNPVRLRVSVLSGPTDSTARLDIQGRGQDVWGVASRKVIDKLCAAF